jgi:hypothetical protein
MWGSKGRRWLTRPVSDACARVIAVSLRLHQVTEAASEVNT